MRMPFLAGLLITVAATVTVGCASAGTAASNTAAISRTASPVSPASPPPSSPGHGVGCAAPPVSAAGGHVLTLTSAQDGKTYCVMSGTSVLVLLKGTPRNKWRPIRATGNALRPSANGHMTLMIGVTGGSFLAARPGTSVISSARPACVSSATPGLVPCGAVEAFQVTVIVRAS